MAQGNVYAPLYFSTAARGKMSPLGAPGAIKPEKKKKGLGDKMASALGSMIDQSMQGDDEKRIAQLTLRNEDLRKKEIEWESSPKWNQDNYEWEAYGVPHEGHARTEEYYKNLDEIEQIRINQEMGIFDKPTEGSGGWKDFIPFFS